MTTAKLPKNIPNSLSRNQYDDNFDKGKKEEIKVNGEKYKVRPVTLTLSRADTKKITLAVLEEAKKDKDLKKLMEEQKVLQKTLKKTSKSN